MPSGSRSGSTIKIEPTFRSLISEAASRIAVFGAQVTTSRTGCTRRASSLASLAFS